MSLLLTVVSATFFTAGALQPRYGVIGKANNGRGPAHHSITQRSGSNGEGNMNGNGNKDLTYGASPDAPILSGSDSRTRPCDPLGIWLEQR